MREALTLIILLSVTYIGGFVLLWRLVPSTDRPIAIIAWGMIGSMISFVGSVLVAAWIWGPL